MAQSQAWARGSGYKRITKECVGGSKPLKHCKADDLYTISGLGHKTASALTTTKNHLGLRGLSKYFRVGRSNYHLKSHPWSQHSWLELLRSHTLAPSWFMSYPIKWSVIMLFYFERTLTSPISQFTYILSFHHGWQIFWESWKQRCLTSPPTTQPFPFNKHRSCVLNWTKINSYKEHHLDKAFCLTILAETTALWELTSFLIKL